MRLVFDTENDGLYDEATRMWCIVAKDIDTKEVFKYAQNNVMSGIDHLMSADSLIGHNIVGYDVPVILKIYGIDLSNKNLVDTLVLSRLLNPDRPGGHSLAAWGDRMGRPKPEHEDWSRYSPEMLNRCIADVEINEWVYWQLMKEMKG